MPFCLISPPFCTILILLADRSHPRIQNFQRNCGKNILKASWKEWYPNWSGLWLILICLICMNFLRRRTWMALNLKKDFILTSFNHRRFALPAFCGLFHQCFVIWRTFLQPVHVDYYRCIGRFAPRLFNINALPLSTAYCGNLCG